MSKSTGQEDVSVLLFPKMQDKPSALYKGTTIMRILVIHAPKDSSALMALENTSAKRTWILLHCPLHRAIALLHPVPKGFIGERMKNAKNVLLSSRLQAQGVHPWKTASVHQGTSTALRSTTLTLRTLPKVQISHAQAICACLALPGIIAQACSASFRVQGQRTTLLNSVPVLAAACVLLLLITMEQLVLPVCPPKQPLLPDQFQRQNAPAQLEAYGTALLGDALCAGQDTCALFMQQRKPRALLALIRSSKVQQHVKSAKAHTP
jgi:hypothetical protein